MTRSAWRNGRRHMMMDNRERQGWDPSSFIRKYKAARVRHEWDKPGNKAHKSPRLLII